ncbi:unnamed protein product [Blepharisma stoltei]|uniref:Uncharacterized protein n=1 Tax=Blepharisma stoltei TaxID=1481888 RepID=A0AAU9IMI8_9CILI|nr:unnamed protein product [Blepharisma stoltei]
MNINSFQFSTEDAKRIILEAPDTTRKTAVVLFITLGLLIGALAFSLYGMTDSWNCELDSSNQTYNSLCHELRGYVGCRNVKGPLSAEIIINYKGEAKASATMVCPWDNAISELRVCFILVSILSILMGIRSLTTESKKQADMVVQVSYIFSFLLLMASTFDLFAVNDSELNNKDVCTLSGTFEFKNVESERLQCGYTFYSMTGFYGYLCGFGLLISALQLRTWKDNLTLDGL